ncbi:MAG: restriction endonuclease [Nitrospinae bacterium]|nr:restriction endonuclease [Nitrospinota bacterium]
MTPKDFEALLEKVKDSLNDDLKKGQLFKNSKEFENQVRNKFEKLGKNRKIRIDFDPHPYVFPDIAIGVFGVEVKFTANDTWRSVANSIFETTRNSKVTHIYVLFGKMGGKPSVRWGRYEDCVMHVRTSHVPRFEVEMGQKESLFHKFGISYDKFSHLPEEGKMRFVREYARGRLGDGERLWWLEDKSEQEHSLPLEVKLYMNLPEEEKRKLRAEAAILCPQVVKPSRAKKKYNDAALYLLTYHGVMCPQARDLFSAGSVAGKERGGKYIQRALANIEGEMREAATKLENALFEEYWGKGESVPPDKRIAKWLSMADKFATDWHPSDVLFRNR